MDDEECVGELSCASTRGKPLHSHINLNFQQHEVERLTKCPTQEIVGSVCPKCPLFETKPGNEPVEIQQTLNDALELEELFGIGFKPSFEDVMNGAITIRQIAALKGLKLGRDLAERERGKELKKTAKKQAESTNPQSRRGSRIESFE